MTKPECGRLVLITGGWYKESGSNDYLSVDPPLAGSLGELVQSYSPGVGRGPSSRDTWLDVVVITGPEIGLRLDGSIIRFKTLSPLEALALQTEDQ